MARSFAEDYMKAKDNLIALLSRLVKNPESHMANTYWPSAYVSHAPNDRMGINIKVDVDNVEEFHVEFQGMPKELAIDFIKKYIVLTGGV